MPPYCPLRCRSLRPRIVNIAYDRLSNASERPASLFGCEDTIITYASSKAAVTKLTVQYGNEFRRSAVHAHVKINTAMPDYIATDPITSAATAPSRKVRRSLSIWRRFPTMVRAAGTSTMMASCRGQ